MKIRPNDSITYKLENLANNLELFEMMIPELKNHREVKIKKYDDKYVVTCGKLLLNIDTLESNKTDKIECQGVRFLPRHSYNIDEEMLIEELEILLLDYKKNGTANIESKITQLIDKIADGGMYG